MATITKEVWNKVEAHFKRPCEINGRGEIFYRDGSFRVGYFGAGPYEGWLVDTTGDRDELIAKIA